jgi:hypothetical protein
MQKHVTRDHEQQNVAQLVFTFQHLVEVLTRSCCFVTFEGST